MPNQSLVDLTERTATADSDLIHVNSGGSDYKQTKANFTFDLVQYHEFNNTESLTSQCDYLALSVKSPAYYVGKINSYGHQSATGVPFNNSYHVQLSIYSGSYAELTLMDVDDGGVFRKIKANGTWQSSWTMQPTRAEITALNNSLTNSLVCTEIFRKLGLPTTATAYACEWQNYNFLIISAIQYGNIRASIIVPYAEFYMTSSGRRPQVTDTYSGTIFYDIYQNGSGSIYVRSNATDTTLGVSIYGVGRR